MDSMEFALRRRAAEPQAPTDSTITPPSSRPSAPSVDGDGLISSFSSLIAAKPTSTGVVTPSISQSPSSSTSSTIAISTGYAAPATTSGDSTSSAYTPFAAIETAPTHSTGVDHRTLTIILSSCLGFLGLLLLILAFYLIRRYRLRQPPFSRFSHRGASPIDDEEIATWRGNSQEMAKTPAMHVRNVSSIVVEPAHAWTWDGPTSPGMSPIGVSVGAGAAVPYPPPVVARAPNARSGLTDDAVPGDVPFVKTAGRHSRRLSKAPSNSHMRTKSRRSSASVHSVKEGRPSTSNDRSQWREPDDWAVQRKRSHSGGGRPKKSLEGRTSMGDDVRPMGLAPRPQAHAHIPISQLPGAAL